jgi:hypothetical protein
LSFVVFKIKFKINYIVLIYLTIVITHRMRSGVRTPTWLRTNLGPDRDHVSLNAEGFKVAVAGWSAWARNQSMSVVLERKCVKLEEKIVELTTITVGIHPMAKGVTLTNTKTVEVNRRDRRLSPAGSNWVIVNAAFAMHVMGTVDGQRVNPLFGKITKIFKHKSYVDDSALDVLEVDYYTAYNPGDGPMGPYDEVLHLPQITKRAAMSKRFLMVSDILPLHIIAQDHPTKSELQVVLPVTVNDFNFLVAAGYTGPHLVHQRAER